MCPFVCMPSLPHLWEWAHTQLCNHAEVTFRVGFGQCGGNTFFLNVIQSYVMTTMSSVTEFLSSIDRNKWSWLLETLPTENILLNFFRFEKCFSYKFLLNEESRVDPALNNSSTVWLRCKQQSSLVSLSLPFGNPFFLC